MSEGVMVMVIVTACALGAVVMFISAVITSYAIEKRSDGTILWRGIPRYTNMFRTAFAGKSIANDAETRELVARLRKKLMLTLLLFALMIVTVLINT